MFAWMIYVELINNVYSKIECEKLYSKPKLYRVIFTLIIIKFNIKLKILCV